MNQPIVDKHQMYLDVRMIGNHQISLESDKCIIADQVQIARKRTLKR